MCEDLSGDLTLVKLDGELREKDVWRSVFTSGSKWEGCRVKMSGLHPQDRLTAARHGRLFGVVRSIKDTRQRFIYILRAYGDARIEKLEEGVARHRFAPCGNQFVRLS